MEFRTIVKIEKPGFEIMPMEKMLFVGSCFADNIGRRFVDNKFNAIVNPYGVMYTPASILHTVERMFGEVDSEEKKVGFVPRVVFFTLGTNHVYRLKETGEIVDNCQKRPARLFQEEELSVDQCADYIMKAVALLRAVNPDVHIVLTVSPIRYAKYGFHASQLSKATLLLAAEKVLREGRGKRVEGREMLASPDGAAGQTSPSLRDTSPNLGEELGNLASPDGAGDLRRGAGETPALLTAENQGSDISHSSLLSPHSSLNYFPSYEIVNDELRDYRFYREDMLHPTDQAVEYIWQRLQETYFSEAALRWLSEWKPVREALNHRPFNPDSPEYIAFMEKTRQRIAELKLRYPELEV